MKVVSKKSNKFEGGDACMGRHLQVMKNAVKILSEEPYMHYIDAIYLYGSCATGKQKFDSDVDLLIQYNQDFTPGIGRKMRIAVMPDDISQPDVELKFVKQNQWRQQEDPFSRNLRKEGILLWKKS